MIINFWLLYLESITKVGHLFLFDRYIDMTHRNVNQLNDLNNLARSHDSLLPQFHKLLAS